MKCITVYEMKCIITIKYYTVASSKYLWDMKMNVIVCDTKEMCSGKYLEHQLNEKPSFVDWVYSYAVLIPIKGEEFLLFRNEGHEEIRYQCNTGMKYTSIGERREAQAYLLYDQKRKLLVCAYLIMIMYAGRAINYSQRALGNNLNNRLNHFAPIEPSD